MPMKSCVGKEEPPQFRQGICPKRRVLAPVPTSAAPQQHSRHTWKKKGIPYVTMCFFGKQSRVQVYRCGPLHCVMTTEGGTEWQRERATSVRIPPRVTWIWRAVHTPNAKKQNMNPTRLSELLERNLGMCTPLGTTYSVCRMKSFWKKENQKQFRLEQPKLHQKDDGATTCLHSIFGVDDVGNLVQHVISHPDPR